MLKGTGLWFRVIWGVDLKVLFGKLLRELWVSEGPLWLFWEQAF